MTGGRRESDPGRRSRARLVIHVALWTALFYGLAVLVAKLAEWASP